MRKLFLSGFLLIAVSAAICQTPMQLLHTITSPFEHDLNSWGKEVKGNADINGDGYNDIIIAGRPLGGDLGRRDVYIYLGGKTLSNTPDYIITDPSAPGPYCGFGSSIAYNGDLNGDGYCDLVIGEPLFHGADAWGRVHIYYGGPYFDTAVDVTLDGRYYGVMPSGLWFGNSVDISGDFNGDGYNDLLVHSLHHNVYHLGQINIFYGGPDFDLDSDWSHYGVESENFGISLSVGDFNGDGFSDLATWSSHSGSAYNNQQTLNIFLGTADFEDYPSGVYQFDQNNTPVSVLMNADINQDGYDDLLVAGSQNKVLWGTVNGLHTLSFSDLNLPVSSSKPAYYAASGDTTFVVSNWATAGPYRMRYYLNFLGPNNYYYSAYYYDYYPDAITGCGYGYFLGDVNGDDSIDLLVTNRIENKVVFQIITTNSNPDSIDDPLVPASQNLSAYPNPFVQGSTVSYDLKYPEQVLLSVYNTRGQLVATLEDGYQGIGQHTANWDGRDQQGRKQAAGIYLIKLQVGQKSAVCKKVTLTY